MKTAKAETTNEIEQSEVMNKLYRAMAVAQAQIIVSLSQVIDDEDREKLATLIIEQLEAIQFVGIGTQCESGTVWNPITQRCE